jgi:uncharacterized repeat protein (TIGR01451 family)
MPFAGNTYELVFAGVAREEVYTAYVRDVSGLKCLAKSEHNAGEYTIAFNTADLRGEFERNMHEMQTFHVIVRDSKRVVAEGDLSVQWQSLWEDTTTGEVFTMRGPKGLPGTPGRKGDSGLRGMSAYDIAVKKGFYGSEDEWLKTLKGVPGSLVRVQKVDENGELITKTATFGLFRGERRVATARTVNGIATFTFGNDGLAAGEYTLKEVSAPRGYLRTEETWPVVVTADTSVSDTASAVVTTWNWTASVDGTTSIRVVNVEDKSDVVLDKSASVATAAPGDIFTYTLKVTNIGTSDATAVTVVDNLPAEVYYWDSIESDEFAYDDVNKRVTWTAGALAVGESKEITFQVRMKQYLPTGTVVECQDQRSQHKNRDRAMQLLRSRLYDAQRQAADRERADARRSQVGSGDRSQRIRTYNYPQGRVTDHRINLTLYKLEAVLAGDLNELTEALTAALRAEQLKGEEV